VAYFWPTELSSQLAWGRKEKTGLFYVRFMDDWIVLPPYRWKLKKAIQIVNQTLNELKVEKHPDKTFIGRIAKGFDFLGYCFEPKGLSIAPKTLAHFLERKDPRCRC
jgi:RNA-directed DNA polymerase